MPRKPKKTVLRVVTKRKESDGKKALRMVTSLKRGVEVKHLDSLYDLNDTNWNGSIRTINAMAQGMKDTERIGDKVKITSVEMNFISKISEDSTIQTNRMRVIVIWDKQNSITLPSDFILTTGTTNAPEGFYNYDKRKEFVVLFDRKYNLIDEDKRLVSIHLFKKVNKLTQFNSATTTINTGALKLIFLSNVDDAGISANKPDISGSVRVRYVDN